MSILLLYLAIYVANGLRVAPEVVKALHTRQQTQIPKCPCSNQSLCEPLTVKYEKEFVAFSANVPKSVYEKFDWTGMTTIIVTDCTSVLNLDNCTNWDPQFVCYAHQRGVRVIRWPLFGYTAELLSNYSARFDWIQKEAELTTGRYWDGINLDWELAMQANNRTLQLLLTEFVNDVATVFRIMIPGAKISFDVPFSPIYPLSSGKENLGRCVFDRCFDYPKLASILDYLFIMDYDIYVWDLAKCHAVSNSPLPYILEGIDLYIASGIDSKKLIAGLPWYGYLYKYCILPPNITSCPLPYDINGQCLIDKSRYESKYWEIEYTFTPLALAAGGQIAWDEASSSPYLWWWDSTKTNLHHIWYDNPQSLQLKVAAISSPNKVGGIGVFAITEIDLLNSTQVQAMYAPFNNFMRGIKSRDN